MVKDRMNFGAVHLEVTHREKSLWFYRDIIGLRLRKENGYLEMGTDTETLVVLHPTAKLSGKHGYSGLYHFAIHLQSEAEFARVLARLISKQYPISPTDHTISKAIYLNDPDGITVEITFETPERFSEYIVKNGRFLSLDRDGTERLSAAPLDVGTLMQIVPHDGIQKPLPADTVIGHIHLYVGNLEKANDFYKQIGFEEHSFSPQIKFADLSAGGVFKHRMAINTWQGLNAPQPPDGTARMRHFTIKYVSEEGLKSALANVSKFEKTDKGYIVFDPSGTRIILTTGD